MYLGKISYGMFLYHMLANRLVIVLFGTHSLWFVQQGHLSSGVHPRLRVWAAHHDSNRNPGFACPRVQGGIMLSDNLVDISIRIVRTQSPNNFFPISINDAHDIQIPEAGQKVPRATRSGLLSV